MIYSKISLCFLLFLSMIPILCSQTCTTIASNMGDVTPRLKMLGNMPLKDGMVDREKNIWDLQVYDEKIYLGFGSTVTNAGPINIYAYDPTTKTFLQAGNIRSEAIERLRVWDGKLFIPNSDPTSGDLLKYKYNDNGVWNEISDNHKLAHVRDIFFYNEEYFLLGNSRCPNGKTPNCAGLIKQNGVGQPISNDLLESELTVTDPSENSRWNWFFGALEIENKLIAPNAMFTKTYNPFLEIPHNIFFQIDSTTLSWSANMPPTTQLKHHHFYPVDTTVTQIDTVGVLTSLRVFESVEINTSYLYTVRTYSPFNAIYQSSYNNSAGLIFKDSLRSTASFVTFADTLSVGEDLLTFNNEVYALANRKINDNSYIIYIYKSAAPSTDSCSWEEVLHFSSSSMARSFEYYDGYFYFGLGNNHGIPSNQSGMLLSLSACDGAPPSGLPCDDLDPCTNNDETDGYGACHGLFIDTDNDGVCDYFDDCPLQFQISSTLQFDQTFSADRSIIFDGIVNLSTEISLFADTIVLIPGAYIDATSIFLAAPIGCL